MDKLGYAAFSPAQISKIMEQARTDSTVTLQGRAFTLPVEPSPALILNDSPSTGSVGQESPQGLPND